MKQCNKCKKRMPLINFTKDSSNQDKLSNTCRSCQSIIRYNKSHRKSAFEIFNEWKLS